MARKVFGRRPLLVGVGAAAMAPLGVRRVQARDVGLQERIDRIYSHQFHFDSSGEPQVAIGLMKGLREVVLTSTRPIRILPSGISGGTVITAGSKVRIAVASATPAKQRFSVIVGELPLSDTAAIRAAVARWEKLGVSVTQQEVGALFGVSGKVLDTRVVRLTTGDHDREAGAMALASELVRKHAALGGLHPVVGQRAQGRLTIQDLERGTTVAAESVTWFSAEGDAPLVVHDPAAKPGVEPRSYRGQIYTAIDRHGTLAVVNLVSETEILAGLVPAEIFPSAPADALRAQAVAARGQLVAKVGTRHLDDPFLLCADQHCQVYAGLGRETPSTTAAVRDTRGMLLMRPSGAELVDTVYSANCGGHTEDNDAVWPSPPDPQLRGAADPLVPAAFARGITEQNLAAFLAAVPPSYSRPLAEHLAAAYRWEQTLDPAELARAAGLPADFGPVRRIDVRARGRSGRAIAVAIVGDRREHAIAGELRIRKALGGLKSSMFAVDPERDRYGRLCIRGGGHGHGVGLCQHGAIGMAERGKGFREILAQYYRGASVQRLW